MFKITIEGETLADLTSNIDQLSAQLSGGPLVISQEPKPTPRKSKAEPVQSAGQNDTQADVQPIEPEDEALQAELNAPVPDAPATANTTVDAGTGRPIAKSEPPLQMTFDDVKVAAGKLAAKDIGKLTELLGKYKAANLSGVPKDKLGDFAADVLEAIE